ncbi:MAG: hypothetical protein ACRD9Y_13445 [Blastocatellia bacterium]
MIEDTLLLNWSGPFVLQGPDGNLLFDSPIASECGIYIFTVIHRDGFLIYLTGWTTRPFKKRLKEHMREYRKGTYTIFNTESLRNGKRDEIWHGMWTKRETNTREMKALFESRHQEINPAIENLLSTFRIFVAPLEAERRVLARIEAAIMNILYSSEEPFCSLPDKGMALAPRWASEQPFLVKSKAEVFLHALPQCFEA